MAKKSFKAAIKNAKPQDTQLEATLKQIEKQLVDEAEEVAKSIPPLSKKTVEDALQVKHTQTKFNGKADIASHLDAMLDPDYPDCPDDIMKIVEEEKVENTSTSALVRKVGWRWRSADKNFGILEITNGTVVAYMAERVGAIMSDSQCWKLTKLEKDATTTYTVDFGGSAAKCGCPAYKHSKNYSCKHIEALRAIGSR